MELKRVARRVAPWMFVTLAAVTLGADRLPSLTRVSRIVPRRHAPIRIHERRSEGSWTSINWSGYAVTGAAGSVSDAKGSWIVPAVNCSSVSKHKGSQYSSFWVGIDGFNSSTVEQTGTDSDCQNGNPVYYAWFEFYPNPTSIINSVTVHPGDTMSAEVSYANGWFTVSLTNVSNGQTFSASAQVSGAQLSSAEWIAEAPAIGNSIVPLANFGTVDFGQNFTNVTSTSYATAGGVTGAIGSFGPSVQEITMVGERFPHPVKAQPSALSADGSSFSATWLSAGP